jgi:hypothetical protein
MSPWPSLRLSWDEAFSRGPFLLLGSCLERTAPAVAACSERSGLKQKGANTLVHRFDGKVKLASLVEGLKQFKVLE